jgi:hypothetical protein
LGYTQRTIVRVNEIQALGQSIFNGHAIEIDIAIAIDGDVKDKLLTRQDILLIGSNCDLEGLYKLAVAEVDLCGCNIRLIGSCYLNLAAA